MKAIRIPNHLLRLLKKTLGHYFSQPLEFQILVRQNKKMQGRCKDYVFQMSHGTQQIKLYEPKKYKNDSGTPLRNRSRLIMKLATENGPAPKEKLNELFRNYPYHLLKSEAINLRMKNFYFDVKRVRVGDIIEIYRLRDEEPGQQGLCSPDPDKDIFYTEQDFAAKKTIHFEYEGRDEEHYYGVNKRSGEISNLLHYIWE